MGSNKKNNLAKINTNSINKNYDKRKSYLSQGNNGKNKENKDNSSFIKNKSYNENISYNEEQSIEKNSSYLKPKENKVRVDPSKKSINEYHHSIRNKKSRKSNLQLPVNKHLAEKSDRNLQLFFRNPQKERHKSFNYSNQKKTNSIFLKRNYLMPKISSELINDSSKQILVNKSNLLINLNHNKTQIDRNKYDENNNRTDIIKNTNTEVVNSTKNLNIFSNNHNGKIGPSTLLKTIIKNKLKLEISEPKEYHD